MDSFEFNKIAAAVLSALLLIFGTPILLDIVNSGGHGGEHGAKVGYKLPDAVASADHGGGAADVKKGFEFNKISAMFADANADAGKAVFKKCTSCHTVNDGGKNGTGPNLWGVVGRDRGATSGFKYSKAMTAKGGAWDYASLAEFIYKPNAWLKGTKMAFAGLKDPQDRKDLIAFLKKYTKK